MANRAHGAIRYGGDYGRTLEPLLLDEVCVQAIDKGARRCIRGSARRIHAPRLHVRTPRLTHLSGLGRPNQELRVHDSEWPAQANTGPHAGRHATRRSAAPYDTGALHAPPAGGLQESAARDLMATHDLLADAAARNFPAEITARNFPAAPNQCWAWPRGLVTFLVCHVASWHHA